MTPKSIQEAAERAVAQVERQLGGLNGWPATTRQRVTRIIATEFQPAAVADGAKDLEQARDVIEKMDELHELILNGESCSCYSDVDGVCVSCNRSTRLRELAEKELARLELLLPQPTPPAEPSAESTGEYRRGQLHALEACREVATAALAPASAPTEGGAT